MFNLLKVIIDRGKASKLISAVKARGALCGAVVYGNGTASSAVLKMLSLSRTEKEVVFIIADEPAADAIAELLRDRLRGANAGIGFGSKIERLIGKGVNYRREGACGDAGTKGAGGAAENHGTGEAKEAEMIAVQAIVDRGIGEKVVEISSRLGNKGATILHGRGAGEMQEGLFHLKIEPEKDIVLMLVAADKAEELMTTLHDELDLEGENTGIVFSTAVDREMGILK